MAQFSEMSEFEEELAKSRKHVKVSHYFFVANVSTRMLYKLITHIRIYTKFKYQPDIVLIIILF